MRRLAPLAKFFAIIAFTLFVLNIAFDNPYTHFLIRKIINEKVEELTPFSVEFESMHANLIPLQLDLYGFRLKPKLDKDHTLVAISRVNARVAMWTILVGKVRIAAVDLYEFNVDWPPGVALVWPDDKNKDEEIAWPPEIDPRLDRIRIHNGSAVFATSYAKEGAPPPRLAGRADGINIEAQFRSWQDISADIRVNAVGLSYQGKPMLQPTSLNTELSLKKELISSSSFRLDGPQIKMESVIKGQLKLDRRAYEKKRKSYASDVLQAIQLGMEMDMGVDLSVLAPVIHSDTTNGPITGKAKFNLDVAFTGDKAKHWGLVADVKSHGGEVDGFKLFDSESRLKIDEDQIVCEDTKIKVGEEQLGTAQGFLKLNDAMDMRFEIVPDKMPLKTLLGALKVKDFNSVKSLLSSPKLVLSGRGDPLALDVRGPILLQDITLGAIAENQLEKPSCATQMQLSIDATRVRVEKGWANCLPSGGDKGNWVALTPDSIKEVEEKGQGFVLKGPITFDTKTGLDLSLRLVRMDTKTLQGLSGLEYTGEASGDVAICGSYDDIVIQGLARSPSMELFNLSFANIMADVTYRVAHNELLIQQASASVDEDGGIEIGKSSLNLDGEMPLKAKVHAHQISQDFWQHLNESLALQIPFEAEVEDVKMNVEMPLKKPFLGRGDVAVKMSDVKVNHKSVAHEAQCQMHGDGAGWDVSECKLSLGDFYLDLNLTHERKPVTTPAKSELGKALAKVGLQPQDDIKGKMVWQTGKSKMDVRRGANALGNLPYVGEIFTNLKWTGALKGDFVLEGAPDNLQGQFWTEAERMRLNSAPMTSIYAKGFFDNGRFDLVDLRQSGASLRARLTVEAMKPGVPFYLFARTFNFDVRSVLGKAFYNDARNFLYVTSEFQYEGLFSDWWNGKGYAKILGLNGGVALDGGSRSDLMKANLAKPVWLTLEKGLLQSKDKDAIHLVGDILDLNVKVDGTHLPDGLAIGWNGAIRIDPLAKTFAFIETAKGEVRLEGAVSGSVSDPDITCYLRSQKPQEEFTARPFEPLTVGITGILPAFTHIDFELAYENGVFHVDHFTAEKGNQGRIKVAGDINPGLPLMPESRMVIDMTDLEFNRLAIPVLKTADAQVSGSLLLTGRQLPFKLSGNVDIVRASSIGNFDLREQILEMIRKKRYSLTGAPQDPILNFDIQINAADSVRIKNRNMAANLTAELNLKGTNTAPIALGQLKIAKGTFIYKRDFDIIRGNITFEEPISPPDPRLDIAGETIVSQYKVTTAITGYASDPIVTLSIDPPTKADGGVITKLDILYLLSSGNLPKSDPGGVSSGGAAARAEAFNLLLGQFEEPIEKIFDLSGQTVIRDVYLDTYPSESADNTGRPVARLNMPIHITDNINLVLQVDDDTNSKISSEYSINENISVTGSFDRRKNDVSTQSTTVPVDTNLDLKFRFSFP